MEKGRLGNDNRVKQSLSEDVRVRRGWGVRARRHRAGCAGWLGVGGWEGGTRLFNCYKVKCHNVKGRVKRVL